MTETAASKTEQSEPADEVLPPLAVPPPAQSRGTAVAWTLVVVLMILVAGYVTLPMWRDNLPSYVQDRLGGGLQTSVADDRRVTADLTALRTENDNLKAAVTDLRKNLEELRARLAAIDDLAARQKTGEKALEEVRTELKSAVNPKMLGVTPRLTERIDALEKSMSGAVAAQSGQAAVGEKLDAGVSSLTGRIDAVEATVAELRKSAKTSGRGDALVLAAGQMRDALFRAAPFEAEIATLKNLAGDDTAVAAAIAPLENMAAAGIPSRAAVLSRLSGNVDAIVAATRNPDDGDWIDRAVSGLRGFVKVRRVDGKGSGRDAILARAEAAAKRGDLAVAAAEMEELDGNAAETAKPWLQDARARLAAEAARAALNRIVLNGLASSG